MIAVTRPRLRFLFAVKKNGGTFIPPRDEFPMRCREFGATLRQLFKNAENALSVAYRSAMLVSSKGLCMESTDGPMSITSMP